MIYVTKPFQNVRDIVITGDGYQQPSSGYRVQRAAAQLPANPEPGTAAWLMKERALNARNLGGGLNATFEHDSILAALERMTF